MIKNVGQIMLYVNNQDECARFWTEKLGFTILSQADDGQEMKWIEIAPTPSAETSFVLHNKDLIARLEPELNLGTPSLMFFTENLDQLYEDFSKKNITVGEIVPLPGGRVFNFADNELNYFAVMEKNK